MEQATIQRLTMTRMALGAEDGISAYCYEPGNTYDFGPALTRAFLGDGSAVLAREDVTPTIPRLATTADEIRLARWQVAAETSTAEAV